jgi:hypothetical protein
VTFSAKTLSLLVLISMGLSGLALLVTATGSGRRTRETRGPIHLDDALRGILEGQARAIQRLERAVRGLQRLDGRRKESIEAAVRNVGLVRYDAFEDVGGRLSFSCALLDDQGDGVVLTSINGRQETRVYAKQVSQGTSSHNLSLEEEEAIRRAMGGRQATVETG